MAVSPELARRSFRTSRRSTVGLQALKRYYTGEWSTGPKLRSVAPRTCGGSGKEPMKINRRDFLAAGAASLVMSRFRIRAAERLPLAFSTLGCPAWELSKILDFAQTNGYSAVELRGLLGSLDLRRDRSLPPNAWRRPK